MKSILDREFRYVPSFETDLRQTFARIRIQLAAQAQLARSDDKQKVVRLGELKKANS